MALTKEQFTSLRSKGFTPEKIATFEKRRSGGVLDVADKVIGKGVELASGNLVQGIPQPLREGLLNTAGAFIPGGRAEAEPFLKDPRVRAAQGLAGSALTAGVVPTALGVGGGLVGEAIVPEGRKNIGGLVGGLAGFGAGKGITSAVKAIAPKTAGGIINSLIKPRAKAFQYGKNPGREVAKQGITGNSFEQLGKNISTRIDKLNSTVKSMVSKSKKSVDLRPVLATVDDTLVDLRQNPNTNASIIKKIEGFKKDLLSGGSLESVSATKAQAIKQGVGKIARFRGLEDPPAFTGLVNKTYHTIRTQLEASIPSIAKTNKSIANLIGAERAIEPAIARAARQPAGGLFSAKSVLSGGIGGLMGGGPGGAVAGVALNKALQSPASATRIAGLLSKLGK